MSIEPSDITLRQLEILRAVIRCRTTVAAASQLGLSQPAVSNAIKIMESRLGFALFERINARLYPTEEAATLYRESEPIFSTHAMLRMRIQDLKETRAGLLRIMATPPLGYSIIPPALKRFLVNRSKVRVSFDVRRYDGVLESVENNIAELGFVLGLADASVVNSEVLHHGSMVCVFRPDHPLGAREVIAPQDLVGENLIALERTAHLGAAVRRSYEAAGVALDYVIEVRYCNTACVLAEAGLGVAIVDPFTALCPDRYDLVVRPFEPRTDAIASVIWSRTRPLSRLASAFINQARAAAAGARPALSLSTSGSTTT
ncbi:MAG: LysR family transcriptional regulator, partial [Roseovarius sp.]|nr:LysR family transcriptional regulator [Roseovarius sp.]